MMPKKITGSDNETVMEFGTNKPIRTMDDAIKAAGVDLKIWYVERWECSHWTVGMSPKHAKPLQMQQYRVKLFLKRLVKKEIQEAVKAVYAEMKKYAPKYQKLKRTVSKGNPSLAVFGLFDSHFGKLCWKPETGTDYDLKIAETLYKNAVIDLVARCGNRNIDSIVLPIGNDFFHVDNKQNTTYRGTPQDVDGRYVKIFSAGKLAVIWAVEELMKIADVKVMWIPGNHDPTISYHLCETLDSWFHNTPHVEVDVGPSSRKYHMWHDTLLGFTHGDTIKPHDLPGLMSIEQSENWSKATCREWLLGHMHRSREWVTKGTDTFQGTTVRVLQSLAGTDAWHHEQGFVGQRRAAEVYFYEKEIGYVGHTVVPARS